MVITMHFFIILDGENVQFMHPFYCITNGASNSVKSSFFIKQVLEHSDGVFSQIPQNFVWLYSFWQDVSLLRCRPLVKPSH